MATSFSGLTALMHKYGDPVFQGRSTLLFPFKHCGQMFHIQVDWSEEGAYVRFSIPCFLNLSEAIARETALMKLLELNRFGEVITYGVDPYEGEVVATVDMLLADNTFTEQQMCCYMDALAHLAMEERERLLILFRTGIYPLSEDTGTSEVA